MQTADTPEKLYAIATQLKQGGAIGCLVSGGCLPNGSVPLKRFVRAIEKIKSELELTVFVHTGTIDYFTAKALKKAGVDAALIDVIGSNETIREVYNLNLNLRDYEIAMEALEGAGLNFVPHVVAGLHDGKLKGELNALKAISSKEPSAIVIIAFTPIRGTEMVNVNPPQPLDIAKVVATARSMFPKIPIVLGCMRPKGEHRVETDILSVKAGVDAIAFPSTRVICYTQEQGYDLIFSSYCCAQSYLDISTK
jgi:uncharacterized radical SAM superfamily protein